MTDYTVIATDYTVIATDYTVIATDYTVIVTDYTVIAKRRLIVFVKWNQGPFSSRQLKVEVRCITKRTNDVGTGTGQRVG